MRADDDPAMVTGSGRPAGHDTSGVAMSRRTLSSFLTVALAAATLAVPVAAQARPEEPAAAGHRSAARAAADRTGLRVRWDAAGDARRVTPTRSRPVRGNLGVAALAWLRSNHVALGLDSADLAGVRVERVLRSHGAHYVSLQQYDGARRVLDATAVAVFSRDRRLVSWSGRLVHSVAAGPATLGLDAAVRTSASRLGLGSRAPRTLPRAKGVDRVSNPYAAGLRRPDPVSGERIVFHTGSVRSGSDRAAWLVGLEVSPVSYLDLVIDAQTGAVLRKTNRYSNAAQGTVWTSQNPTTTRQVVPFTGWVSGRTLSGNNTNVYEDRDGNNASDYQPQTPDTPDPAYQHFDYPFTNAWQTNADGTAASLDADRDAVLTQLFYWVNFAHDRLYGLGFNEASGNFQVDNFGRGGTGGDAVQAEAFDQFNDTTKRCNANFNTGSADGSAARLQVFVSTGVGTCPWVFSEIEGDTVVHEYGHGVFARLINGGMGEGTGVQKGGMDEGIGDYLAASFFNDPILFEFDSGNATTGLRRVAYDTSGWTYQSVCNAGCEVHRDGEVWATALWDLREVLVAKYGAGGAARTDRLVLDGLRSTPASASFLDWRDGILAADAAAGGADKCAIWGAFVRTKMGVSAATAADQQTVTEATDVPAECMPTAEAGGPYTTPEGTDAALSGSGSKGSDASAGGIASYAWDLDNDGAYDDSTAANPSFTNVGDNGSFTVGLQVTDAYGQTATDTASVSVTNVNPTVAPDGITSRPEGTAVRLTGKVTDPGWLDSLSATVDWGDGAGAQALGGTGENTRPDATLSFDTTHTYGDDGSFTVKVCGTDDDTGSSCATTVAVVTNVPPTAVIDKTATVVVQGIPTFFAHVGQVVPFSMRTTDPGSDDLRVTWDWGDGAPSPDLTRNYPVNAGTTDPDPSPSIQPRDLVDSAPHAFTGACFYTVTAASADDDGGSAADNVAVIITGNVDRSRGHGWWKTHLNRPADFSTAKANCLLAIVGHYSAVFHEKKDASTVAKAIAVLTTSGTSNARDIMATQLIAVWLNFANGALDPGELVDTDGKKGVDTPFLTAVTTAEAVYNNPNATRAQILAQKDIMERIALRDGG